MPPTWLLNGGSGHLVPAAVRVAVEDVSPRADTPIPSHVVLQAEAAATMRSKMQRVMTGRNLIHQTNKSSNVVLQPLPQNHGVETDNEVVANEFRRDLL